jgi:hypothetical protein
MLVRHLLSSRPSPVEEIQEAATAMDKGSAQAVPRSKWPSMQETKAQQHDKSRTCGDENQNNFDRNNGVPEIQLQENETIDARVRMRYKPNQPVIFGGSRGLIISDKSFQVSGVTKLLVTRIDDDTNFRQEIKDAFDLYEKIASFREIVENAFQSGREHSSHFKQHIDQWRKSEPPLPTEFSADCRLIKKLAYGTLVRDTLREVISTATFSQFPEEYASTLEQRCEKLDSLLKLPNDEQLFVQFSQLNLQRVKYYFVNYSESEDVSSRDQMAKKLVKVIDVHAMLAVDQLGAALLDADLWSSLGLVPREIKKTSDLYMNIVGIKSYRDYHYYYYRNLKQPQHSNSDQQKHVESLLEDNYEARIKSYLANPLNRDSDSRLVVYDSQHLRDLAHGTLVKDTMNELLSAASQSSAETTSSPRELFEQFRTECEELTSKLNERPQEVDEKLKRDIQSQTFRVVKSLWSIVEDGEFWSALGIVAVREAEIVPATRRKSCL